VESATRCSRGPACAWAIPPATARARIRKWAARLPSSRQVPELAGQDHSPGYALAQQATRRRRALDLTVIFARRHDVRRVEDGSVALAGAVTVPMRSILALTCGSGWAEEIEP
jgi:hypothetical protein